MGKRKRSFLQERPCVGLSEINSKNYKIILDKVKYTSLTSVPDSPKLMTPANAYNIKTKIKQQQKHLNPEEIEQIVQRYQNGESTYKLAKEFDCHRSTIANNLRKQGIEVSIEKINLEEAIKLYELGWTTKQLAERYHMSDNAVSRRLKKAGIRMRTRWDY